jgi:hypothetical protein
MVFQLPISGVPIRFRAITGVQERDLWDARDDTSAATLARVLGSLCESVTHGEWLSMPVTDADAALLAGRQAWVGDRIETTVQCSFHECRDKADVDFRISDFMAHRRAAFPKHVGRGEGVFMADGIVFRAPTLADEEAALASGAPARTLRQRCIDSATPRAVRKIERLLEKMAPNLSSELSLRCPGCGRSQSVTFDPRAFVLKELGDQAQFLWDDVHLLASTYHWPQAEILALERGTRAQLAERVRSERLARS